MKQLYFSTLAALILAAPSSLAADPGSFTRSDTTRVGSYTFTGVTEAQLKDRLEDTNSRIIDLEISSVSPLRFDAVTVTNAPPHTGGWWWAFGLTEREVDAMAARHDARIIDVEVIGSGQNRRFAVVMRRNTGANAVRWQWEADKTIEQLVEIADDNDLKVADLERYTVGGNTRFAAIMTDNRGAHASAWEWYVGQTAQQVRQRMRNANMRLIDLERHGSGGNTRYDIVLRPFEHSTQNSWYYLNLPKSELNQMVRRHGARVIDLEPRGANHVDVVLLDNGMAQRGDCRGRLSHFRDALRQQMKENAIPGAQVAVVKDGRLVYSCALGTAEIENGDPVKPDSLFRIMSVSKLITRSAVRQLAGPNTYRMGTSMLRALGDRAPEPPFATDMMRAITVDNLVDHETGLWRDTPYDPMVDQPSAAADAGLSAPLSCQQIMQHTIKTFPLNFIPGTAQTTSAARTRAYSNVGYCILQQILAENAPGTYQQIIKREILEPAGVTAMRIGRGRFVDRAEDEVKYYHTPFAPRVTSQYAGVTGTVPLPYSYVVEAMAGHGGWLASANDLVRYAAYTPTRPDGASAINHGGYIPGTRTQLRQVGDVYVAIVTNATPTDFDGFDLSALIDDAVAAVDQWPTRDLWEKYGYPPAP